jgi:putative transposase
MAQTLTLQLMHIVFSTKERRDLITPAIEPLLFKYIGAICKNNDSPLLAAGGTTNHVHLLISLSKTMALADLMLQIKRDSSKWIKSKGREFAGFLWQEGYAGFSIGASQKQTVIGYLARQKEKHRRTTFQQELLALLQKYNMPYDPEHLWD